MALDLDILGGARFRRSITEFCKETQLSVDLLTDEEATLRFRMPSGVVQTAFVRRCGGDAWEFAVPSGVRFAGVEDVPGPMSTMMLIANARLSVGFWCLKAYGGQVHFTLMHNEPSTRLDGAYFKAILERLASECDELEQRLKGI